MVALTSLLHGAESFLRSKLVCSLSRNSPHFYGTRSFITALTSVRHLSLSWASPMQSTYPHPMSWRSILILSTHLRLGLPSGLVKLIKLIKMCLQKTYSKVRIRKQLSDSLLILSITRGKTRVCGQNAYPFFLVLV